MTQKERIKLAQEFRDYKLPKRKTKGLFLICSVGLVGVGKTTLMKKISQKIGAEYIRSDAIRLFVKKKGIVLGKKDIRKIMILLGEMAFQNGTNVVMDADFILESDRDLAKKFAKKYSAKFQCVRIVCDQKEHIRRILKRDSQGGDSFFDNSVDGIYDFFRRSGYHFLFTPHFDGQMILKKLSFHTAAVFDTTTRNVTKQVNAYCESLEPV